MAETVRLFAWQPQGHGEYSFFVAAHSEEDARACVERYIAEHLSKDDWARLTEYSTDGWGTDYYELTVLEVGQVISNSND